MKYSGHKEINKIVRELVRQGWVFWHGSKHGRLRAPWGSTTLTVPVSPRSRNVARNFAGDARRAARR